MMPKFYDYIVAEELAGNTYISPPDVNTAHHNLYFDEDNIWEPITYPRGGNILRESFYPEFMVLCNAASS